MEINKDNIQTVNELKIGDMVQILDYQFEVVQEYFLALRNAKNFENNGTIFIKLGIDSAKFSKDILGYYNEGGFPECRTLADLTKLVKALFVEAEKQEQQQEKKEKEQPIYKWAQGNDAIKLLEKEGGKNLSGWAGTIGFFYMPYNGGIIEFLTNCEDMQNDYIKSHGIEIKPVEILDKVEKKYLGYMTRPWRHKIEYIYKRDYGPFEYIGIKIKDEFTITLPNFIRGTMYKKMITDRRYTLEELGL